MIQLLVLKDRIRGFYRKFSRIIIPIVRFLAAWLVFTLINQQIGYDERLLDLPVVAGLSFFCAFVPSSVMVFLAAVFVIMHILAASKILSLVFVLVILILYFMFARFTPRYGWVVLAIPILYQYHLVYLIPLLLGLIATPVSALSMGCGVIVYYLFQLMKETALLATGNMGVEDSLAMYTYVVKSLVSNHRMLLTIGIFTLVTVITWLIRRCRFKYAYEIAILSGTVANILLFLICDLFLDVSDELLTMILGSIASGLLAYLIQFFRFTLEYSTVENVQFEDDDYYYYVKAVPKLKVTTPEVNVKKFTSDRENKKGKKGEQEEETGMNPKYGRYGEVEDVEELYENAQDYEQDRPRGR